MKNTIVYGALLTLLCTQSQADVQTSATTTTPASQPAVQGTQPTTPVQAQPTTSVQPIIINCDYKIPASTKVVEQSIVLTWSEKAVAQAFNFTPDQLETQMKSLQQCFTDQGWTGFNNALQKSGNVDAIKAQKLTVSSQVDGQVTMDEVKGNQWKLTLPLQVVYQNDKEKVTQLLAIKLTVSRKINGDLGITQMIAIPRSNNTQANNSPTSATPASTGTSPTPAATTPNDTTNAPTTATPNGTPTTPNTGAPTLADPSAQPTNNNKPIDQQPNTTAAPANP